MSGPICILGRQFGPQELTQLQTWIDQRHGQSRRALSVGLAKLWDWHHRVNCATWPFGSC